MLRNNRARTSGRQAQRRCTLSSRKLSVSSLAKGTTMLAKKTNAANSHEPSRHRKTTPERMVSAWSPKSESEIITGITLAGM